MSGDRIDLLAEIHRLDEENRELKRVNKLKHEQCQEQKKCADKIIKNLVERATRKPINIQVRSAFMVVGQCPTCRWSTTNQNASGGAYEGIVFCQNCGQAIDWTDWSEEK